MPGRPRNEVRICDLGYTEGITPLFTPPPESPACEPHTPRPKAYIAHSDWADEMMKTHEQRRCKGCGKYQIWVPKTMRAQSREDNPHDH